MKIALVTGGSRGLGRNTVLALAQKGNDVIFTYRSNKTEADQVVRLVQELGRKAVALQLDVSNSKVFTAFAGEVKTVLKNNWNRDSFDFLVNNAGTGLHAPFAETTEEQFDELVNVHLKGTYFLTQKLLSIIADGGRIINISSGLARFTFPGSSAYAAMKGGIEVLTRYMAKELGPRGIAVNTVAPGAIETDFNNAAVRNNPEMKKQIASITALGRVGVADDIGGMIDSLLSEDNRWVNGQRIEASGGMML